MASKPPVSDSNLSLSPMVSPSSNLRLMVGDSRPYRSAFSPPVRVQVHFPDASRTKQSFKAECDINTIMARYRATGQLPANIQAGVPSFVDIPEHDFRESMELVARAQSEFERLPSDLRARFSNDPAELLAFVEDERNRDEARELGLLREPVQPPIAAVEVVSAASRPPTGDARGGDPAQPGGPGGSSPDAPKAR